MKNYLFILFLFVLSSKTEAQDLIGEWVKTDISYLDGTKLSEDNLLMKQYMRYSFEKGNILYISTNLEARGTSLQYERSSNTLQTKNATGFVMNSFQIESITNHELILIQKGSTGYNEKECLKFTFIKETDYQAELPLNPSDIVSINENDSTFRSTTKVHPVFLGEKTINDYCLENVPDKYSLMNRDGLFVSTFVITKEGEIKEIAILKSINQKYDKQLIKAIEKSKGLWKPALHAGKNVDVQMSLVYKFVASKN